MSEHDFGKMAPTEFTFRVGLALGAALTRPQPTLPQLEPGQTVIQMWSAPDHSGYRYLLSFAAREVEPDSR